MNDNNFSVFILIGIFLIIFVGYHLLKWFIKLASCRYNPTAPSAAQDSPNIDVMEYSVRPAAPVPWYPESPGTPVPRYPVGPVAPVAPVAPVPRYPTVPDTQDSVSPATAAPTKQSPNPTVPDLGLSIQAIDEIANRHSPVYVLSKDERYYPVNFNDILPFCSIRKASHNPDYSLKNWSTKLVPEGKLSVPVLLGNTEAVSAAGLASNWLPEDYVALSIKQVSDPAGSGESRKAQWFSSEYALALEPPLEVDSIESPAGFFEAQLTQQSRICGHLDNPDFDPKTKNTWYHNGAPGCPTLWKSPAVKCLDFASKVLEKNRTIPFTENPQFTMLSQKQIFKDGIFQYWVTDFIYSTYIAFNGSISILPSLATHFVDIEIAAVRFLSQDLIVNKTKARPIRYFISTHAGSSWWSPDKIILKKLNLTTARQGDDGAATHPVIYWGRESHECYTTAVPDVRLFGVANDVLGGGVIWQPRAQMVPSSQDDISYNIMVNKNPSNVHLTYVFPPDSVELPEIFQWIFFAGRIRPQAYVGFTPIAGYSKNRLPEGMCVADPISPGTCIASSAEPSSGTAEYVPVGAAPPLGDLETWNTDIGWYDFAPANCFADFPTQTQCWSANESCCAASRNYKPPATMYAITSVRLTKIGTDIPPDYTGVAFNTITKPSDKKMQPSNMNQDIGGSKIGLIVKYELVDKSSPIPVLTGILVRHWKRWKQSCPSGYIPLDSNNGKITGNTKLTCDDNGLCVRFEPMNKAPEIIGALALSLSSIDNKITFIDRVNGQNIMIKAPPDAINVQKNCCALQFCVQKYLYLCTGSCKVYREIPPVGIPEEGIPRSPCSPDCSEGPCYGSGSCCIPDCSGKECGDDGCGGTCAMCPVGQDCDTTSGKCYAAATEARFLDFSKDAFGTNMLSNIQKTLLPFLMDSLLKGIGSEAPDGDTTPEGDTTPCAGGPCYMVRSFPETNSVYLFASNLGHLGSRYVTPGVALRPIIGIIENLAFSLSPGKTPNVFLLKVTSASFNVDTSVHIDYVKQIPVTAGVSISHPKGIELVLRVLAKLPTDKPYASGFITDTAWGYPPNSTLCSSDLFSPMNPCADTPKTVGTDGPIGQGLGFGTLKPDATLTGKEFRNSIVLSMEVESHNLKELEIKVQCNTGLGTICNMVLSLLKEKINKKVSEVIAGIPAKVNPMLQKELVDYANGLSL